MKKILLILFISFLYPVFILAQDKIEINTASLSQLDELTGIGPKYAQAIIDGRPYSSVDDLDRVKGIGPATLQKIKDQGLACVNCGTAQPITQPAQPVIQPATPSDDEANQAPITYPGGVFINEILPNPAGADSDDEWIELYNSNSTDVDLSGWQLQDITGTVSIFTINPSAGSGQVKILAGGFLVFKRPETKIMLNNDEDGINLLTPDNKIIDSINYTKAPLGQSYNKAPSGLWTWSATLTPGAKNIIPAPKNAPASATSKALPADLSNATNSVKNDGVTTNQDSGLTNPWFLFFTVLAVTIILAVIVLFIKLKFSNHVRT